VGYFDFELGKAEPWETFSKALKRKLARDALRFLRLPDGSEVVLVRIGSKAPPVVLYLGSEGDIHSPAPSLEAFLLALAEGNTGVIELDDEEAKGRKKLGAWLAKHKVKAPKAPAFDFEAWSTDSKSRTTRPAPAPNLFAKDTEALAPLKLEPLVARIVSLIGRRVDDPVLIDFFANVVGRPAPASLRSDRWVTWTAKKVEFLFDPDSPSPLYPPIKQGKSTLPYLTTVQWGKGCKLPPPLGITPDTVSKDEMFKRYPKPDYHRKDPRWHIPLIRHRDVVLSYYTGVVYLRIKLPREKFTP
jgi:hypothetical protein